MQVRCKGEGKHFVNGISSCYDDSFPQELEGVLSEQEFCGVMHALNDVIMSFWPCNGCYIFGYVAAPCTLGLSLCCPGRCADMAEQKAHHFLEHTSMKKRYYENKVTWRIRKTCFSSWVEISFPVRLKAVGGIPEFY